MKIAEAHKGKTHSAETRAKISVANTGKPSPLRGRALSEETKAKLSVSMTGKTHSAETIAKISAALRGKNNPMKRPEVRAKFSGENNPAKRPEVRAKISTSLKKRFEDPTTHPLFGKKRTKETKAKQSASMKGCTPWNKGLRGVQKMGAANIGKVHSNETRAKISASWTPEKRCNQSVAMTERMKDPDNRAKISRALTGRSLSEETRAKQSAVNIGKVYSNETRSKMTASWTPEKKRNLSILNSGENGSNWQGGKSFEPYCPKFNNQLKESIRNRDERRCQLCGKSELLDGRKLSIHHINSDKMQGCHGKKWYLCALCRSCNNKPDTLEKEFLIVSNMNQQLKGD